MVTRKNLFIASLCYLLSGCATPPIALSLATQPDSDLQKVLSSLRERRELADTTLSHRLFSTSQKIEVDFFIGADGTPYYKAIYKGKSIIEESRLGLDLKDKPAFQDLGIQRSAYRKNDSTYSLPVGKAHTARDHYEEYSFELQERSLLERRLIISFRIYEDGFGIRYILPRQKSFSDFEIAGDRTSFQFKNNPVLYALPLPFQSTFEGYYSKAHLNEFAPGQTLTLPVLIGEGKSQPWLGLTEAALSDSAGMYLNRKGDGNLSVLLAPDKKNLDLKIRGQTPYAFPWRVVMIGETPSKLLESNIVNNLNEPSAVRDTSWIHPGKIIFPWWSDYKLATDPGDSDPSHKPGLTTWALKKYIDFCAENKIEYFSLDGFDQAWYGGDIGNPSPGIDLTKAIAAIDLPEVLRYGRQRGVRARLWMHKNPVLETPDLDALFSTYEKWGIEGVMIDFLNGDDQETVRAYTRMIQTAARHHLTINFHGSWKPTGLSRTYPNLLSHEAVMSSEYNRFVNAKDIKDIVNNQGSVGSPPEHEVIYTWVRQLAGPTDIHPGSFNPVLPENFDPSRDGLRAMGTLARQLALYVVVETGLPMVADAPGEYLSRPLAFEFIKNVPVAWDETKFVGGEIGQSTIVARRKGLNWYLGGITDRHARQMNLPLTFLGEGHFAAEIYRDGPKANSVADSIEFAQGKFTSQNIFKLKMAASGGIAVRFVKQP